MVKPRLCPYCNKSLPLDKGYFFDAKLNLICAACGKVVMPTDATSEAELAALRNKNKQVAQLTPQGWNSQVAGCCDNDTD
jgi:hypothetical protein